MRGKVCACVCWGGGGGRRGVREDLTALACLISRRASACGRARERERRGLVEDEEERRENWFVIPSQPRNS